MRDHRLVQLPLKVCGAIVGTSNNFGRWITSGILSRLAIANCKECFHFKFFKIRILNAKLIRGQIEELVLSLIDLRGPPHCVIF